MSGAAQFDAGEVGLERAETGAVERRHCAREDHAAEHLRRHAAKAAAGSVERLPRLHRGVRAGECAVACRLREGVCQRVHGPDRALVVVGDERP